MPKKKRGPEVLWRDSSSYMGLYDDFTLGLSDGVGYVATLDRDDLASLFNALKKLFGEDNA